MKASTGAFLYVDDTTLFEAVPMARHITTGKPRETFADLPVGKDFSELSTRTGDRGMRINARRRLSYWLSLLPMDLSLDLAAC